MQVTKIGRKLFSMIAQYIQLNYCIINIYIMGQTQQIKFFHTQVTDNLSINCFQKKKQLGNCVSKLEFHIKNAKNLQDKIVNRKKYNLINKLTKVKEQIYKETELPRKIQSYFYQHCQKILTDDISVWENHKDYFSKMFEYYEEKIQQKKITIMKQKQKIKNKEEELKRIMKNLRKLNTEQFIQKTINDRKKKIQSTQTQNSQNRTTTRVSTQVLLPSLHKQKKTKTVIDQDYDDVKNYMKPINRQKISYNPQIAEDFITMLNWYRQQKQKEYNWFQKIIFMERNFKKIIQSIANSHS